MSSYRYNLFADYFQFYLQDEKVDGNLSDAWNEQAVTNEQVQSEIDEMIERFREHPGLLNPVTRMLKE